MTRYLAFAALAACGSATPASAPPVVTPLPDASVEAPADAAIDAPIDAPPPPPPVAAVDNIIAVGSRTPDDIAALLAPKLPALAACLSSDGVGHATEISFIVVGDDTHLRVAWQDGTPIQTPCLADVLGGESSLEIDWRTKFSTAYAVIRTAPQGTEPPPAPPPPDRKADAKLLFCDLETASGADKLPVREKQQVMIAYGRTHGRHPAPIHIALEITQWNPAELKGNLERALRREGLKKCAMQRF